MNDAFAQVWKKLTVKWSLKYDVMLVMDDDGQCEFLPSRKPFTVNTSHELRQKICCNAKLFANVLQNHFLQNSSQVGGLLIMSKLIANLCRWFFLSLCVLGSVGIGALLKLADTHSCDATKLFGSLHKLLKLSSCFVLCSLLPEIWKTVNV